MPRFQSLAFSALLKGVRKHKRPVIQKSEVAASLKPNEFQLTEPLPVGPVSEIDWSVCNDDGLRLALKVRGVKGINSRWKRATMIAKLIAIGN